MSGSLLHAVAALISTSQPLRSWPSRPYVTYLYPSAPGFWPQSAATLYQSLLGPHTVAALVIAGYLESYEGMLKLGWGQVMQHPWFRTAMPKGMDTLNYNLVQSLARPGLQSVEEIEQVVQAATKLGAAWNGTRRPAIPRDRQQQESFACSHASFACWAARLPKGTHAYLRELWACVFASCSAMQTRHAIPSLLSCCSDRPKQWKEGQPALNMQRCLQGSKKKKPELQSGSGGSVPRALCVKPATWVSSMWPGWVYEHRREMEA